MPAIILVRPRNPLNIGAAARALANFGFSDLRVVSPHPPVWETALASAVGAESLIERARVFGSLREAAADRRMVLGTSCLKARAPKHRLCSLADIRPGSSSAFVFGPEKTGLTAADLEACDALVNIPTAPGCRSMNLGQAVAVVCYELSGVRRGRINPAEERVRSDELERIVRRAEKALTGVGYRPTVPPAKKRAKIRSLLRKWGVSKNDAGTVYEILRRLNA